MRRLTLLVAPIALWASLLNQGCSSSQKQSLVSVPADYADTKLLPLQESEAQTRSKQVGRLVYNLWFGLDGTAAEFEGRSIAQFELKPGAKNQGPLWLDFRAGTLRSLAINGQPLLGEELASAYNGNRIVLPFALLNEGANNRVEVGFTHRYSSDGNGLHRFKDPQDGKTYLYTNFEPFNANQLFPCFDQPDLKATFEVSVEAPEDWQVISVTEDREITTVDGRKSWVFPPSHPISTYVFALHAGPYAVWKAEGAGVPLRLFARHSMIPYVDPKGWFDVTSKGLEFFGSYFGVTYPFTKYDQILVPEFNAGAMENVGAVTFSERYLFRSPPTSTDLKDRADTILHEMAHMWFGNLVTMRWWNGLWLNESFASFLSAVAMTEGNFKFAGVWESFFEGFKGWAYWEDSLPTSHPIEVAVPHTDAAFVQFDGITYGKGAAVLKQVKFALGDEGFKKGLQLYFKRHAFANTEIGDFLMALSQGSGQDLSAWAKPWLTTAGTNTLTPSFQCEGARLKSLTIKQAPDPISGTLRPHQFRIALYVAEGPGGLTALAPPTELKKIAIDQAETTLTLTSPTRCPAMVLLNSEDHGFFATRLDPETITQLKKSLSSIPRALERGLVWHTLKEMVDRGELSAQEFGAIARTHLPKERDMANLELVLSFLSGGRGHSLAGLAASSLQSPLASELELLLVEHLKKAPRNSDRQASFFDAWSAFARIESSAILAEELLSGKQSIGLTLGADRRWKLVRLLARVRGERARPALEKEQAKDGSDFGKREFLAAQASIGTAENKEAQWNALFAKPRFAEARAIVRSLFPESQPEFRAAYSARYFERLPEIVAMEEEMSALLASGLFPKECSIAIAERAEKIARSEASRWHASILKALKVGAFTVRKCVAARAASERALSAVKP